MISSFTSLLPIGIVLALIQMLAALPWLAALDPMAFRANVRRPAVWANFLGIALGLGAAIAGMIFFVYDADRLQHLGRYYGAILHAQLIPDILLGVLALTLLVWPHGGAVAQAAFREGIRQPMYWLIAAVGAGAMAISPFIPYFTFGEDFKMVQELGYDTVMLAAMLFGVLAAAISISDEIEGRTAITLMSKPVSRRQFLLGKFLGIFLASLSMTGLLGWCFCWILWFKPWYEERGFNPIPLPDWVEPMKGRLAALGEPAYSYLIGAGLWLDLGIGSLPGLVLGACQVLVLLAIVVALATRLPMILNLVTCLTVFFLGHLTPVLVRVAASLKEKGVVGGDLIAFVSQLFNTLLPGLQFFSLGPILSRDLPPDPGPFTWYVATVILYACVYAAIALLLGLILFEDRDLA